MRTQLCWFAIAVALAACSHKPPDQKLADDIEPATSWIATLDFASADWLANRVASAFIRESVKSAQKALDKARKAAEQSKASEQLRDAVKLQLRSATDAADALSGAVERGDRNAVQRARSRFSAAYAALNQIEKQHQQ